MAGYLFQKYAAGGLRSAPNPGDIQAARNWLRGLADEITIIDKSKLMRGKKNLIDRIDANFIGKMVMYTYDPKLKEKLPYYDTFPLGIVVAFNKTGFYSLNLHYLPPFL